MSTEPAPDRISNRRLVLILAALLILSLILGAVVWLTTTGGTQVVITVDGKAYASYPLSRDRTVVIQPEGVNWHNTVCIRDGKAWMEESTCANQICVHTPALQDGLVGLIVCLPHGLVMELK